LKQKLRVLIFQKIELEKQKKNNAIDNEKQRLKLKLDIDA
jgi:hypothetical protein